MLKQIIRSGVVALSLIAVLPAGGCGGSDSETKPESHREFQVKLTASSGFDIYQGKKLYIRAFEQPSGPMVTDQTLTINGGTATAALTTFKMNTEYRIDYYVDANGNATCDAPPADGVWRAFFHSFSSDLEKIGTFDFSLSAPIEGTGDEVVEPLSCESF